MCSNSRTMKKQKTKSTKTKNPSRKSTFSTNPSRKTRTKTRKHKFLSLKTELSASSKPESPISDQVSSENNHHQLNLFPLHPGNLFEERETHDENVDYFFDSEGGATTLNGFVWGGGGGEGSVGLGSDHEDSLSPSLTYAYQGQDSEEGGGGESSLLLRNALRHKQRDESTEEKWICYEEVLLVEKKEEENSCCTEEYQNLMHGLCLKLDYEEIMNAWSDKGPLYIGGGGEGGGGDCSQIVPDVLDDPLAHDSTNVYVDGNVPQWKVPAGEDGNGGGIEAIDGGEGSLTLKLGERKARVLRYKEKRQSRLFSKRIRYEVRKLNAEKRPRMKGRFVKRD